jgi:hypothetical protein
VSAPASSTVVGTAPGNGWVGRHIGLTRPQLPLVSMPRRRTDLGALCRAETRLLLLDNCFNGHALPPTPPQMPTTPKRRWLFALPTRGPMKPTGRRLRVSRFRAAAFGLLVPMTMLAGALAVSPPSHGDVPVCLINRFTLAANLFVTDSTADTTNPNDPRPIRPVRRFEQ